MALPPVGVTLVANDSEGFQRALAAATAAVDNFTKSITNSGAPAMDKLAKATTTTVQVVNGFGSGLKAAQGVLSGFGSVAGGVVNTLGAIFDRVFTSVIRVVVRDAIRAIQDFISTTAQAAVQGTQLEKDLGRLGASFDAVAKTSFAPLVSQLSGLVEKAAPGFLGIVQAAETWLGGLGSNALIWGGNVVNQFAQGMWNAIGAVLDALTGIANAVTYWLSPGSPPRLLPDIDKWGTAAANEFFGGWGKADFSVFSDLSSTITNLIRSLPISKGDQAGVVPNILGAREGIAAAVDELRATGTIAAATIDKITAAVGTSDASVRAYLESMVKLQAANQGVKDAQDNLNAVTKTYDDLLKPVDAAIAGITEAQQELADQQKKSLLELVLKDPNATPNEKRAAQLGLEKIDAEQRRRLLVADQKTAVDAATAKLDAAKEVQSQAQDEFDARKAQIQLISDQNSLLKEQLQLLDRLAAAAGGGAGAAKATKAGGGGAATPKPFAIEPFDLSKLIPPGIKEKWDAFVASLKTAWDNIALVFQPTIDAINNDLIPAFNNLKQAVRDSMPDIESQIGRVFAFMVRELGIVGPPVVHNMSRILDDLADVWRNHHDAILNAIGLVFSTAFAIVAVSFNSIIAIAAIAMDIVATVLDTGSLLLQGKWKEALDRLTQGFKEWWEISKEAARTNLDLLLGIFGIKLDDLIAAVKRQTDQIAYDIGRWLYGIGYDIGQALDNIKRDWGNAWDAALTKITEFKDALVRVTDPVAAAINGIINAATTLFDFLRDHVFSFHIELPQLPDWATPGSPTPFEIGLRGISDALQGVANDMYSLRSAATAMGTVAPAINTSTYNNTTQFVYSPTYHSAPRPVSDNFATMTALWA